MHFLQVIGRDIEKKFLYLCNISFDKIWTDYFLYSVSTAFDNVPYKFEQMIYMDVEIVMMSYQMEKKWNSDEDAESFMNLGVYRFN